MPIQSWEYKQVVLVAAPDSIIHLGAIGEEGWELVSACPWQPGNVILFFKRLRPE